MAEFSEIVVSTELIKVMKESIEQMWSKVQNFSSFESQVPEGIFSGIGNVKKSVFIFMLFIKLPHRPTKNQY